MPTAEKQPGQWLHQATFPPKAGSFQTTRVPKRQECTSGNRPNFKIQNPDLNNWGTNCHDRCQPIQTGEISTRLICYVCNTTGCIMGFSQRGVAQQRPMRDTAPYLGHHCWLAGDHRRAKSLLFLKHRTTKITKYLGSFQGIMLCLCLS